MATLFISEIINDREARQRRELKNIPELALSISSVGLINPIVVDENGVLIAGERRLEAVKSLGWDSVSVTVFTDLTPAQQQLIELEENVKRDELPWRDHCAATARYHKLRLAEDPDWSQTMSAEALGISRQHIFNLLSVQEALESGDELVAKADRFSTAKGILDRKRQRITTENEQTADELIGSMISPSSLPAMGEAEPEGISVSNAGTLAASLGFTLLNTSFLDWVLTPPDRPYNFIHCDFPYGVGVDTKGYSASKSLGTYEDTPDVYWDLITGLSLAMDNGVVAKSAHLMFWFSMDYYTETKARLEEMGWNVNPFPLYWHRSDNSGIMPDPKRGPRRVVETAFLASRGDRFVVQPVSNFFAYPNEKLVHTSEKPQTILSHFFRMFVDGSTRMLDPTMGSGNAVRVAFEMGAAVATGLEMDGDFFRAACRAHEDVGDL